MESRMATPVDMSAFSPPGARRSPRSPEDSFIISDLQGEVETLRRKAAEQEESLNKYRWEAEQLIAGSSGRGSESTANGMMKTWLRDAKKQSEELKALFEQSRVVASESAAMAKRDYEKKLARLTQDLAASESERGAARAARQTAEEALHDLRTQVAISCEQRDAAKMELEEAAERHRAAVARLEAEHQAESAKMVAANQQYQTLLREQSQKAAVQEKNTSVMFEQTMQDMKGMMERSRETREKERRTAAAMLESANQLAATQKHEMENMEVELRKVTHALSQVELRAQELESSLAETTDQRERTFAEKEELKEACQSAIVDYRFRMRLNHALSRAWRLWTQQTNIQKLVMQSEQEMFRRNGRVALVLGTNRTHRLRQATLHAILIWWRNYLRLLWRGVVIRSKSHSRLMGTTFDAWSNLKRQAAMRSGFLADRERQQNRVLLESALMLLHTTATDLKWRRAAGMHLSNKATSQGLLQILLAWASVIFTSTRGGCQENDRHALVLARSLVRRTLSRIMNRWRVHFAGSKLRGHRVRIIRRRVYKQDFQRFFNRWADSYTKERLHLHLLTGRVQRGNCLH